MEELIPGPAHDSSVSIGECGECFTTESVLRYVAREAEQLDMIIEFDLALIDHGGSRFYFLPAEWKLSDFKRITLRAQELADPKNHGWAASYLENHDRELISGAFATMLLLTNPFCARAHQRVEAFLVSVMTRPSIVLRLPRCWRYTYCLSLALPLFIKEVRSRWLPELRFSAQSRLIIKASNRLAAQFVRGNRHDHFA